MIVDNLMKHEMAYSEPSMLTEPKKMFSPLLFFQIIITGKKSQFQPPFKS